LQARASPLPEEVWPKVYTTTSSIVQLAVNPGTYTIEAQGGSGGDNFHGGVYRGGRGAIISGTFTIPQAMTLNIVVGGRGVDAQPGTDLVGPIKGKLGHLVYAPPRLRPIFAGAGGGGASLVWVGSVTDPTDISPLIVGAGAAGANEPQGQETGSLDGQPPVAGDDGMPGAISSGGRSFYYAGGGAGFYASAVGMSGCACLLRYTVAH
jgi:hypothetical protein